MDRAAKKVYNPAIYPKRERVVMKNWTVFSVLVLVAGLFCRGTAGAQSQGDLTGKMENLGIPLAQRYKNEAYGASGAYARNVWALKAYDGRLYIGAGNSSNGGPASNAGPVPVISFDPATKRFSQEWNAPDEQLDVFRVFSDGLLYIPGHDPKEDWKLGNFYRRGKGVSGKWEKVRTLPDGVHCYDMAEFDGKLLACGYGTYESTDSGKTFVRKPGPRYYTFLPFQRAIYAVADAAPERQSQFKNPKNGKTVDMKVPAHVTLAKKVPGKAFEFVKGAKVGDVFPGTPETKSENLRLARPSLHNGRAVYIGGIVHNDHQIDPIGAYTAIDGPSCFKAECIPLPAGAKPWYTMVAGNAVYLLWSTADGTRHKYVNHLSKSFDGRMFREILRFEADSFARSVEYLEGYLYFGLGTEIKEHGHFEGNSLKLKFVPSEINPASGTLLRCRFSP